MDKEPEKTFFQRIHAHGQQVCEKMLNITNHQGNANQNYSETSLQPSEMAIIKKVNK